MQEIVGKEALGRPEIEPRWTHSNKSGVGTAYSPSSHLWFTIWNGIVAEVCYPTVDRPQLRDLQYLVTDGKTFFHEDKRDLIVKRERISDHVLGYRCTNADADGRYTIAKDIIGDPHLPCLLQRTRGTRNQLEVWKPNRHVRFMGVGEILRVQGVAAFILRWSSDNWNTVQDTPSTQNSLQIGYVDLTDVVTSSGACIRFTFFWTDCNRWEGRDYSVTVR